jgi:hypothetical protein
MGLRAQWRHGTGRDAVLIVDESDIVVAAVPVDDEVLTRLLTEAGGWAEWRSPEPITEVEQLPEAWGRLVIERADSGEVLLIEPESFWDGIYRWFRSRGIDYDTALRAESFR